jgi:lysophospholipase L1-like esterase
MAVKSGWGPGFCADVVEQVECVNMAKGGRSSGSYRAEGSWAKVMDELKRNADYASTYVLIQFGHNDQPGKQAVRPISRPSSPPTCASTLSKSKPPAPNQF